MPQIRSLSRRQLLRAASASLLAASICPVALLAGERQSPDSHFFVLNDLHYVGEPCGQFLQKVIAQMKAAKEKPDLCLLAGDLSDNGTPQQLTAVRDLLKTLGIPVRVICGNHDYVRNNDRAPFMDIFPDALNYVFDHRGWQFVGLDTCDGTKAQVTIPHPTFAFLDYTLHRLDRKRPIALFTHFPLGPGMPNRPPNAPRLLDLFKDHNLQAVFSGHHHGLKECKLGPTTFTTNRCCSLLQQNHDGSKEKGYFLCHAKDGAITRQFVEAPAP